MAARAQAVQLSGTITYSGNMGSVSGSRPILLELHNDSEFGRHSKVDTSNVTTNPGTFTLNAPASGNYYLAYAFDVNGDGQASVGEPFQLYNGRFMFPVDPIAVPQSGVQLNFDDSGLLSGIAGTVRYDGSLGQVSSGSPLIVAAFADAGLTQVEDAAEVDMNPGRYDIITLNNNTFYLLAVLDLNGNRQIDAGEPFEIFRDKSQPPGSPVLALPNQIGINFEFADENVTSGPTPTSPPPTSPTPTATPTSPVAAACVGDCNGDDVVTVDELLTMVNIALGNAPVTDCMAGDASGDEEITIDEILTAVNNALGECPAT